MSQRRRRIHLETLIGKKVFDIQGRCAGRIHEVRATEDHAGHCQVKEYLLGRAALLESLSIAGAAAYIIHFLSGRSHLASHRVSWDQLDLSNPDRPRLTCPVDELKPL